MKQSFINLIFTSFLLYTLLIVFTGCKKEQDTGNVPYAYVNITINPNSTIYQELNVVSGWTYLGYNDGVREPSRGIIVCRIMTDDFVAFERTPPFLPNKCCTASGICTRLIVEYPYIADTCTQSTYLIIDGSPVDGPSTVPLVWYQADYDGQLLYIHN